MDDPNNILISRNQALKDDKRIKYHNDYLTNLLASIKYVKKNVAIYAFGVFFFVYIVFKI